MMFFLCAYKKQCAYLAIFECKASRQIFNVFSTAMSQSINKAYNMHAIATDGIGYTIPPFARLCNGGLTPYPPKNF